MASEVELLAQQIIETVHVVLRSYYRKAITGRRISTNSVQFSTPELLAQNKCYVRDSDYDYAYRVVWNTKASRANVPVILFKFDGEWQIWDADTPKANARLGTLLTAAITPPLQGDALEVAFPSSKIRTGFVKASAAGGLNVTLQTHLYPDSDGVPTLFEEEDIDLTSNVPGTTDQWRWVVVGVDKSTGNVTKTNGTPKSIYIDLTYAEAVALVDDTAHWRAAVKLRNGQSIVPLYEDDFVDLRMFLGDYVASGADYYQTVRVDGADQTQRETLEFEFGTGLDVTVTDDSGNGRTKIALVATGESGSARALFNDSCQNSGVPAGVTTTGTITHDGTRLYRLFDSAATYETPSFDLDGLIAVEVICENGSAHTDGEFRVEILKGSSLVAYFILQTDGNNVAYDAGGTPRGATGTFTQNTGTPHRIRLSVNEDGLCEAVYSRSIGGSAVHAFFASGLGGLAAGDTLTLNLETTSTRDMRIHRVRVARGWLN